MHRLSTIIYHRAYSIWKRLPFLNNLLTNDKVEQEKLLKILHGETRRVIKLRRKFLNDQQETDLLVGKNRLAFLDMLLLSQKNGSNISDENIQEEVDTFMYGVSL